MSPRVPVGPVSAPRTKMWECGIERTTASNGSSTSCSVAFALSLAALEAFGRMLMVPRGKEYVAMRHQEDYLMAKGQTSGADLGVAEGVEKARAGLLIQVGGRPAWESRSGDLDPPSHVALGQGG